MGDPGDDSGTIGESPREVDGGGPGEGEKLRNFGVRGPVQYYLRLRAKSKFSGNPDVRYELLTELIPYSGASEFEPNDQRADATPLAHPPAKLKPLVVVTLNRGAPAPQ